MTALTDFLDALFGASQAAIRASFSEDSERAVSTAEEIETLVIDAGDEPIYVFPEMSDGLTPFVYTVTQNAGADEWETMVLRPTVALYKDGALLTAWALEAPAEANELALLTGEMDFELGEPIPTPGANGWEMVHCDPEAFHALATLQETYAPEAVSPLGPVSAPAEKRPAVETPPWNEDLGTYDDATIKTPFDEKDPAYAQAMIVSIGGNRESTSWKPKTMPIGQFVAMLCQHPENPKKDGLAYVLAEIAGGNRRKIAVKTCYGVGLDIDVGTSGEVIDAALAKLGSLAVRYTTHSHGKTRTEITKKRLIDTAKKAGRSVDDADFFSWFLREHEKWDPAIIASAEYEGDEHNEHGLMALISHAPMPKHRVVVPFAEPFVVTQVAGTHDEGMKKWTEVPKALARLLGDLPLDKTGVDPSRLFYFPRHAKGKPHETSLFGGPLLDWRTLELQAPEHEFSALLKEVDDGKTKGGRSTTDSGRELGRWSMQFAHGFQAADVIRDHAEERIRTQGSAKIDIECPFDDEHSNPGDPEDRGCMVVNAGDGPSAIFTIKCQHEACQDRTNLDMLGKMLGDGWFSAEVLKDDAYNVAELDDAPNPEAAERLGSEDSARAEYQRLIDALTPEASDAVIEAAIDAMVDAKLSKIAASRAEALFKDNTKLPMSTLRKLIKVSEIAANKKSKGPNDPLGRRTFSFQGEYNFDEGFQECFEALLDANEIAGEPIYSCLQDKPVRLGRNSEGRITFEELTSRGLWAELNTLVTFVRKNDVGEVGSRGPVPKEVADHVYETAYRALPQTPEIIYTPLYTNEGTLVTQPGWYAELGLILADTGFVVPTITSPGEDDVQNAVRWFREEILSDFPFLDHDTNGIDRREPSEANAMAMIITPFMRRMIQSCTPVFFVSKPTAGTGGTFLAKVPMLLFDGQESAPMRYTQNEEEMQKALLASILEARSHIFYDDVKEFNSRSLLQSLTAKTIGGRLLGSTRTVERPNRFSWVATGNNPIVGSEMDRRTCWIRLNARTSDIQQRIYRHPNFERFLLDNREISVMNILVLIENWILKGMPLFKERKRASFEDWSEKVGGVLMCAGIEGFLDNRRTLGSDQEDTANRKFIREWVSRFQTEMVSSSRLLEHASSIDSDILEGNNDDQKKQRFHKRMHSLVDQAFAIDKIEWVVTMEVDQDGGLAYSLRRLHDVEVDAPAESIAA